MPLNFEFKAKIKNINNIKKIIEKIQARYLETLQQIDTYYNTKHGRLKIREINNIISQLIYYNRDEEKEFRWSEYQVYDVSQVSILKNILEKSLGIKGVVNKKREVYILENCRIHVDDVAELGNFVEFEYMASDPSKNNAYEFISRLKAEFSGDIQEIHKNSYIDILLKQESHKGS